MRHPLGLSAAALLTAAALFALSSAPTGAETVVETWRGGGFWEPVAVSVNGTDGSCWVADTYYVTHLSPVGEKLWRSDGGWVGPPPLSVNPTDGSCWSADPSTGHVVHLAADGAELWRGLDYFGPNAITVNPTDGSCWVVGHDAVQDCSAAVHLAADGTELWRSPPGMFGPVRSASVNAADGSCYVGTGDQNEPGQVVRLAANGTELWRTGGFWVPHSISVNRTDGSCWVAAAQDQQVRVGIVLHLAPDGTELSRGTDLVVVNAVSVNPTDSSCWVAGGLYHEAVHLAEDGIERSRIGGFYWPRSVSVNPADSSCWVADSLHNEVVHLALLPDAPPTAAFTAAPTDGTAPLSVTFTDLSANAPSSWLWDFGDGATSAAQTPVHEYADVGTYVVSLTASNDAGSDTHTEARYILVTFPDVPFSPAEHWALDAILACVDAGIVQGYPAGNYGPDDPVTRDQMAVYIARALAGGDDHVPTGPTAPTFTDVGEDHWAYRYIEHCADLDVVQGYADDTYHPDEVVNRGQMAAYVARSIATPTGDAGIPEPVGPPAFPDVTADNDWAWCYKYVQYIAGLEPPVVQGYPDGTYGPGVEVTRDQMAVYVARAFELPL